jgi:hypothetical protein
MAMVIWPSHIWYLMLASEVRPTYCKTEDPLATGKKRKARQVFPTSPRLRPAVSNLTSHLPKSSINQPPFKY